MRSSHTGSAVSIPTSAIERLDAFVTELRSTTVPVSDFEQFERRLHELFAAAESEIIASELAKFDMDVPEVIVDGVRCRRVFRGPATYLNGAAEMRIERSLYRPVGGGKSVCPMELGAGIIEGYWTPGAAQASAWAVAHLTPGESEQLFRRLGGMQPSRSSLDRLPKKLSERWEESRGAFEEAVRIEEVIPGNAATLAVSLDGVKTPMKDGKRKEKREAQRKAGKQTSGPNGYREVVCGTVTLYDADGVRLCTWRSARMPEKNKVTIKRSLRAEVESILAARPDLTLVKVADGARDNWTFLGQDLPDGEECLDFFHAAEHLDNALISAYGETAPKRRSQFEKLRVILRDEIDGVETVIRALAYLRKKHPRRKTIKKELTYFRRNRHRMRYAELKARSLPIGSGVVEAACKTLVTQRMKRSGMRWGMQGGQAILTLRAAAQSERFDRTWQFLAATYSSDVALPDKVVPLHQPAAA